MRAMNVLQSYTDFDWEDLPIDGRNLKTKSKYLDCNKKGKQDTQKNKRLPY
jgi:type I restriction enzyme R subunit